MIAIGSLRIHTALTPLPIAFTLLETINKHWPVNKETGQSEDGIQSLAPGFSTNTYVWKEEFYSVAEVSILRARSPLFSKRTNISLICIFFLPVHNLSLP